MSRPKRKIPPVDPRRKIPSARRLKPEVVLALSSVGLSYALTEDQGPLAADGHVLAAFSELYEAERAYVDAMRIADDVGAVTLWEIRGPDARVRL